MAIYAQQEKKHTVSLQAGSGKSIYSDGIMIGFNTQKCKGKDYRCLAIEYPYRISPTTDVCTGVNAAVSRLELYSSVATC